MGINPYLSWPVSALLCGNLGMVFYVLIVRVIKRRRDGKIALTIAFYALSIVLETLVALYGYCIVATYHETTRGFLLKAYDFELYGYPGVAITTPVTCIILIVSLYYWLTRTRNGVSLRAVAENEDLHLTSWFIIGALAGLAGSIIPLWTSVRGRAGAELLVTVMAGSILGGLSSIVGSVIGGVLITLFQHGGTYLLMNFETNGSPLLIQFSHLIRGFQQLIPIIMIFIILMILPEGITKYIKTRK
jgi:branched-subunit amino acid ABC-type transport system permease component